MSVSPWLWSFRILGASVGQADLGRRWAALRQGMATGACIEQARPAGQRPLMGQEPLPHGRDESVSASDTGLGAAEALRARAETRACLPRLALSVPDMGMRAGSRRSRCA